MNLYRFVGEIICRLGAIIILARFFEVFLMGKGVVDGDLCEWFKKLPYAK